jgi:hypothetical protein
VLEQLTHRGQVKSGGIVDGMHPVAENEACELTATRL